MAKKMKKDNAVILADDGLAKELALSGWVEDAEGVVATVPATQPVPYTAEEIKQVDKQVKVEQAKAEARKEVVEEQKKQGRSPKQVEEKK